MPNKDKTGPQGTGPTGRGEGGCENSQQTIGFGRRLGNCLNRGRNKCRSDRRFCILEQGNKAALELKLKDHQNRIEAIQKRIDELNKQDS